jgi:hypothetical protein
MTITTPHSCLNCQRSESDVPLVVLQFRNAIAHICPQCLPVLIHHPEKMEEKIGKIQGSMI